MHNNRTISPDKLKIEYERIIRTYLKKVNENVREHLVYNKDDDEIRFWNCVDVERAKDGLLWMSINPSGEPMPKNEMPVFNKTWDMVRGDLTGNKKNDRYWLQLLDNIRAVEGFCGHMDLLPIHWSKEKEMAASLFPKSECPEVQLAYHLIQESKKMIDALQPKLIIYSNTSTAWLWGNGNSQFWLGYDPQPEEKMSGEYWRSLGVRHGRLLSDKTSLYTIKLGGRRAFLLIDYQVANTFGHDSLTGEDVKIIWDTLQSKALF